MPELTSEQTDSETLEHQNAWHSKWTKGFTHMPVLPGINEWTKEFRHSGAPECMNQQVNKRIHPHFGAHKCMTQQVNKIHESTRECKSQIADAVYQYKCMNQKSNTIHESIMDSNTYIIKIEYTNPTYDYNTMYFACMPSKITHQQISKLKEIWKQTQYNWNIFWDWKTICLFSMCKQQNQGLQNWQPTEFMTWSPDLTTISMPKRPSFVIFKTFISNFDMLKILCNIL
jgi:hypothetical protein